MNGFAAACLQGTCRTVLAVVAIMKRRITYLTSSGEDPSLDSALFQSSTESLSISPQRDHNLLGSKEDRFTFAIDELAPQVSSTVLETGKSKPADLLS